MNRLCSLILPLGLASVAAAQPQVAVSIGLRETGAFGAGFIAIGASGTTNGGIEWVNLDGQTLTLDGTWQQFTFDLVNDPITKFTGDGVLDGTFGVLEHVRITNTGGATDEIAYYIDDVTNTTTGVHGSATFGDFEGFGDGDEVMFQEPDFSGSTNPNVTAGTLSGVDNYVASRSASNRSDVQFVDNTATRWVRLTTFNALAQRNPQVRFDDNSVISFWMRGGVAQQNLGGQGPGTAIAELVGEGLNVGESSTYSTAGVMASAPGVIAFSLANNPDIMVAGGTIVSGAGLVGTVGITADANGNFTLPVPGQSAIIDVVLQCAFVDVTLPQLLTFTNAVEAKFGL